MSRRYLWSMISFIDLNTSNYSLQIIDRNRTKIVNNVIIQPLYGVTVNSKDSSAFQYFSCRTSRYFIAKNLFYHIATGLPLSPIRLIVWRASVLHHWARQLEKRSALRGFYSRETIYLTFNLAAGFRSSAGSWQFFTCFPGTRVRKIAGNSGIDKIHLKTHTRSQPRIEVGREFSIFLHPRRCQKHISWQS